MESGNAAFDQVLKSISGFKKLFKISPIQQKARDNNKKNKTANKVASGVGAAGTGVGYLKNPIAKSIGYGLKGLGVGIKFIFNDLINPTDPEKIRSHIVLEDK